MKKRTLVLLLLVLMLSVLWAASASAEGYATLKFDGIQDYSEARAVWQQVNEARAANGLAALDYDPTLVDYAMTRAAECNIYYSHTRPNFTQFYSTLPTAFLNAGCGENIAIGYGSASAVMDGWLNSPGHYANIMNSSFQSMGVGCFYQDDGSKAWVQIFSGRNTDANCGTTGRKSVSDVAVTTAGSLLKLHLRIDANCKSVQMFDDTSAVFELRNENAGYSYCEIKLSGGFSVSIDDTSVASVTQKPLRITANQVGSTKLNFNFDGGMVHAYKNVEVFPRPNLTAYIDDNGYPCCEFDDLLLDSRLFAKGGSGPNADLWTWLLPNDGQNRFINSFSAFPGEKYTFVIRKIINGEYIEVSNRCTVTVPAPKPAAPSVTAKTVSSSGDIALEWNDVYYAEKYIVYRATSSGGKYSKIKTTTATQWTDTGATPGKVYYYKVKAVNASDIASSASDAAHARAKLARPSVTLSNVTASGKNRISWKAVSGATKYEIYRAAGSGDYSRLKTTTSTAYTDTSAKPGKNYSYKVRACNANENAKSVFSSAKKIVCKLSRPSVTLSNVSSSGRNRISWKAVSGATKYEIRRATSKTGTYSKIRTTTSTAYTDTSAKPGKTYYYQVRALCSVSSATSANSSAQSRTCRLAQPDLTLTRSSGKPRLKWDAVSGATGYEVWRATSKTGTYTLMGTATGTSYTNKGAKAGKTYYYKLRAVCGKSAAKSVYSSVESIKCTK